MRLRCFAWLVPVLLCGLMLVLSCRGNDDDPTGPSTDTISPAAVMDLTVTDTACSSITLEWTAPGDDGTSGTATKYDVRYSTSIITDSTWNTADTVAGEPSPQPADSAESFVVSGLQSSTTYYFALKTADEIDNWSVLSNVDSAHTDSEPVEPMPAIDPDSLDFGIEETELDFTITNGGDGTLTWTITVDSTWITVSPASGSTATEEDTITVTVDRTGLNAGSYSGTVTVTPGEGAPEEVDITMTVSDPVMMVLIPAGTFTMGDGLVPCGADERVVTLTNSFYLGKYEVTNQEYCDALQWAYNQGHVTATSSTVLDNLDGSTAELVNLDGSYCEITFSGGTFTVDSGKEDHPMLEVSWYGSAAYCDWLSMQVSYTRAYDHSDWSCNGGDPYGATGYRLPTDAEWEYATQYDDERSYPWGNNSPDCDRANFHDNGYCVGWTSPVGSYGASPAALDLYDMAGNVFEWCNDWHTCNLGVLPETNPTGPASGLHRVLRGGSWYENGDYMRCSSRVYNSPSSSSLDCGFRCARSQ